MASEDEPKSKLKSVATLAIPIGMLVTWLPAVTFIYDTKAKADSAVAGLARHEADSTDNRKAILDELKDLRKEQTKQGKDIVRILTLMKQKSKED